MLGFKTIRSHYCKYLFLIKEYFGLHVSSFATPTCHVSFIGNPYDSFFRPFFAPHKRIQHLLKIRSQFLKILQINIDINPIFMSIGYLFYNKYSEIKNIKIEHIISCKSGIKLTQIVDFFNIL